MGGLLRLSNELKTKHVDAMYITSKSSKAAHKQIYCFTNKTSSVSKNLAKKFICVKLGAATL